MATKVDGYTKGCARQKTSPSTQRIDCGLSAMKTYDNADSGARCEEDSLEAMDGNTKGYNQEGTSARSRQTSV